MAHGLCRAQAPINSKNSLTMKTEKQLLEQRANLYEQMKELTERAKKEERDMSADELEQFERMDEEFQEITRQIEAKRKMKRAMSLLDGEPSGQEPPAVEPKVPEYREVFRKYIARHRMTDAELEVLHQRAQSVGTDSAGGYTVPDELMTEVITSMKYYSGILEAARIINTSHGRNILWPTVDDTSNTGAIIGENAADSEQDLTFGQKTLGAYMGTSRVIRVSVELLADSAVNIEQYIFERFAERLGRLFNNKLTVGTGTSEPSGIVTDSSLGVTAAATAAVTRDELVDLVHSVDRAYRMGPKVGFMMNDSTLAAIKKLSFGSSDDRPLWQPSVRVGEPDTLEGYPYWVNNDMASLATGQKTILFGDFSKYIVRFAGPLAAVRLNELYANNRQVGYNSFQRFDGLLTDTAAVKHLIQA